MIVVVHDLNASKSACEEATGEHVSWFEDVLVADYPDAHVFSFCPVADVIAETLLTGHSFQAQAWELLSSIQREREAKHCNGSEILFLASGVGLLIVEQALVIAHQVPRFQSIRDQTSLVGFLEAEALKGPEAAWEELSLGAAVRFNKLYGWSIATTLRHLSTVLQDTHSAFAWIAGRYKIITSEHQVALRTETATHEVLNEWQKLSDQIRRVLIPSSVDSRQYLDEIDGDSHKLILSKLAPSHIHALASPPSGFQTFKFLEPNKTYQAWRDADTSAILYVYGSGKTALAPSLGAFTGQTVVTAYLSFADVPYDDRTMLIVLKVLLFRTLCTVPSAFNIIKPIWRSFGQISDHTVEQLWLLIESLWLFPDAQSVYYIIDGIDLCECSIANQLEALIELACRRGMRCKVLATSRAPNDAASAKTDRIDLHPLLLRRENVKEAVWPTMRNIMTQTCGLAELEKTIIDRLQHSMSPSEINIQLQAILHFVRPLTACSVENNSALLQRPLPELYTQLLTPVTALETYVRTTLSWMVLSFRPLSLQELAVAITVYQESLERKQAKRYLPLDLGGDLTRILGPLVEIRNSQPMFVNESITKFIKDELAAHLKSSTDPRNCGVLTDADLTRHCLAYLKHSGVTRASPEEEYFTSLEQSELDFKEYAAQYWPRHYRREDNKTVLVRDILDFFSEEKCANDWAEWWRTAHMIYDTDTKTSPLALAAEHGLCEVVNELIPSSKDEFVSSHEKSVALERALKFGHLDVARQLLHHTTPSNKALILASRFRDADLVTGILQKLEDPASACPESLEVAAVYGHLQIIDALLQMIPDALPALEDLTSVYPKSIRSGQKQVLKRLLEVRTAPLPAIVASRLLCLAARRGNMDIIRLLQGEGYSIDEKYRNSMTILHYAAAAGSASVITELLPSLDAVVVDDDRMSPLHHACKHGNFTAFTALLEASSPILEAPDVYGNRPIHLAAAEGHLPIVVRLLELGVHHETPNRKKFTPLHLAAQGDHLGVVQELTRRAGDSPSVDKSAENPVQSGIIKESTGQPEKPGTAGARQKIGDSDMSRDSSTAAKEESEEDKSSDEGDEQESEDQDHAHEPTPLHSASLKGYADVVKVLIEAHADCNYSNQRGSTPLHLAVYNGQTSVVKMLLDAGADPKLCDMDGRLPIHLASEGGNIFIFRALLQAFPDVNVADDQGKTPLHISAGHGYDELVALLLERRLDPNDRNNEEQSALYCAIESGNPQVVKRLLEKGAKIDGASQNQTLLVYEAVRAGQDMDVIRLLMEASCNPLAKGPDEDTSLLLALRADDLALVLQLLERVTIDIPSILEYSESLFDLAQWGCLEGVKKVLDIEGVDITLKRGTFEVAALHEAAQNGEEEIVQLLLDRGADPNEEDNDTWTPLIYALVGNHAGVAENLLNSGVDPNTVVEKNLVPLHKAIYTGNYDLVKLLLDRGASIPGVRKDCAPILAWPLEHPEEQAAPIVELLLQHGASPFDIYGEITIIEHALWYDCQTSLGHLVEYGIRMLEDESDFTPLHLAAMLGDSELIERHSASLGTKDKRRGRTALHWAACTNHAKALLLLIDLGSELTVQDKYGSTPLHLAAGRGKKDAVNAIIQKDDRCAIIADTHGWLPIHRAHACERTEIVPILGEVSPPGILNVASGHFPGRWVEEDDGSTRHVVTEDGLRVITSGIEPNMTVQIRANHPMPVGKYVYYYEMTIIRSATERILGLGFCEEDADERGMPGWDNYSWGYHADNGHLYAENGEGKKFGPEYGDGDVVGCGVDFDFRCAFFTYNGEVVGTFDYKVAGYIYPVLGFGENEIELTTNFGPDGFCFKDLDTYSWRKER